MGKQTAKAEKFADAYIDKLKSEVQGDIPDRVWNSVRSHFIWGFIAGYDNAKLGQDRVEFIERINRLTALSEQSAPKTGKSSTIQLLK